jgi:hypothetical protein
MSMALGGVASGKGRVSSSDLMAILQPLHGAGSPPPALVVMDLTSGAHFKLSYVWEGRTSPCLTGRCI